MAPDQVRSASFLGQLARLPVALSCSLPRPRQPSGSSSGRLVAGHDGALRGLTLAVAACRGHDHDVAKQTRPQAAGARKRSMSDDHKSAIATGRNQTRAISAYLEALTSNKPRPGRRRTAEGTSSLPPSTRESAQRTPSPACPSFRSG